MHSTVSSIPALYTCTNLLESLNDWTLYLQDKHNAGIVYADFSKAFDVVSHNKLFVRLQA